MKISGFFKFVKSAIMDPERDFSERVFLILTIISELTVPMGLLGDIILGENRLELGERKRPAGRSPSTAVQKALSRK